MNKLSSLRSRLGTGLKLMTALLMVLPSAADVLPANLPAPDTKPVDKSKPVKVFILSGQSNMLGFGKVEGSIPLYSSIFLSADPSVKPSKMPVDNSALMPHGIFQSADVAAESGATAKVYPGSEITAETKIAKTEKVALGTVSATIPAIEDEHTVIVEAYIDVPYDGIYEVHAGMDESSYSVATINGKEVYRKNPDTKQATLTKIELKTGKRYPLVITYFKGGGSAAFWMEKTDMEGMGDLKWAVQKLGRFPYLLNEKGEWTVRNDVMLNDAYMGKGKSAPLSALACGPTFGPELGFGYVMGAYLDEPVIVIKADIGNRSLAWDILPPGSESYTFEGKQYPGYGQLIAKDGTIQEPSGPKDWYAGKQYDDYTASIHAVLNNFGERYPEYKEQGFEVAGFAWWQGHKDGGNPAHISRYETNLANLIKAWRKEFKAPNAKWAIATVGFQGENMSEKYVQIAEAQMAVADPKKHPELAGTVKTIDTRPFWRGPEVSPKNQDYHYNHNGETYMLTGDALGRAMVELMGGKVEYPPAVSEKTIKAVPFMKDPSSEEVMAMSTALSPIVTGKLIPEYIRNSAGIPAYRRNGMELKAILENKSPEKAPRRGLKSQLDKVIDYYNVVGVDTYDWKTFGPDMQKAKWYFHNFDPKEKYTIDAKGRVGDMYRDITLPEGMKDWYTKDFDPAKAGWSTGAAPFGQVKGELKALKTNCRVPHCRCDTVPGTLWEKEVLLMRQTFEIPDFKEGHRYRIIVGGAGHGWSGEGFALYLNGKQIAEETGGGYKNGGNPRGAYVFENIIPEFKDGKATFAIKAFLRRTGYKGKLGSISGHMSVWMQEAKLPAVLLETAAISNE